MNDLLDMKEHMSKWCPGCQRIIGDYETHDEGCSVEIESAAQQAQKRRKGAIPFQVLLLLYGIFLCIFVGGFIFWRYFH